MPVKTLAAAAVRKRLLKTSAPSREIGWNSPPCANVPARKANSASEPPTNRARMARMKTPRAGSLAKEWTEVNTPERTRNVPRSENENVRIASSSVQIFSAARFSMTMAECKSAVPDSQGMKLAFSTGSQNQNPPQPSS